MFASKKFWKLRTINYKERQYFELYLENKTEQYFDCISKFTEEVQMKDLSSQWIQFINVEMKTKTTRSMRNKE